MIMNLLYLKVLMNINNLMNQIIKKEKNQIYFLMNLNSLKNQIIKKEKTNKLIFYNN